MLLTAVRTIVADRVDRVRLPISEVVVAELLAPFLLSSTQKLDNVLIWGCLEPCLQLLSLCCDVDDFQGTTLSIPYSRWLEVNYLAVAIAEVEVPFGYITSGPPLPVVSLLFSLTGQ